MMTTSILNQTLDLQDMPKVCMKCHRPLRSEQSLQIGLGPVCAKKMGIPYPSKLPADACKKCHGEGMVSVLDSTGDVVPDVCPACGGNRKEGPAVPVDLHFFNGAAYAILSNGWAVPVRSEDVELIADVLEGTPDGVKHAEWHDVAF